MGHRPSDCIGNSDNSIINKHKQFYSLTNITILAATICINLLTICTNLIIIVLRKQKNFDYFSPSKHHIFFFLIILKIRFYLASLLFDYIDFQLQFKSEKKRKHTEIKTDTQLLVNMKRKKNYFKFFDKITFSGGKFMNRNIESSVFYLYRGCWILIGVFFLVE